ncbi:vascular non-inflammatory molecule 3 [Heterocephalus glaber]|uniref:Vascular non-inflammatory molecule 3 n=2 Tax=Heterocephalus glaber TaxID=10181 RepID=A0AAX6QGV1_HETGA|nr:vascular non-inflammatory molecule 3 [Heterocephalus glaber]
MITLYFPKQVVIFGLFILNVRALDTFIAAVYEHAVILPNRTEKPVSHEEALLLMNKNIDVLEKAVKLAAQQGAHIIVTPEDGIYGWVFTRESIYPYLEDIPAPEVNWIPCRNPKRFGNTPVQERLSCLAKDNSIYVVANIGDKKPCNASDPQCPPDGRYQYNTNVVFDAEGRLVARYHKYNLFAPEIQFDFPKDSELVTFDTPFGKFGVFTCFDIFSHNPAVALVDELQVDSVLYPTAWYNTLPLLSAAPFHSAWARAMRVNLLAANTHNTSMHMTGSGIYAPEEVKVYHYDMETSSGQLMLAELKSRPPLEPTFPPAVDWSAYARSVKPFTSGQSHFPGMIYFDEFTFTELKGDAGNYTVCHKDLCCHITYKMSEKRGDEVFALGAFDGLHTVEGQYYLQICTLLKCQTTDLRSCGEPVGSAFTKFEEFSLSGTFGTSYVFPQIVLSGSQLAPERHYEVSRDGRLRSRSGAPLPVLVMALYGRVFEKDPPRLGQGPRKLQ